MLEQNRDHRPSNGGGRFKVNWESIEVILRPHASDVIVWTEVARLPV